MKRNPLCKSCRQPFERLRPLQQTCTTYACIKNLMEERAAKTARKTLKDGRQAMKSSKTKLTEALNKTQLVVNRWCRLRDIAAGYGCISCGKMPSQGGDFHGGHYIGRAAAPEKRFLTDGINLQCYKCNCLNSGGIGAAYRRELIVRIGIERVEAHEAPMPPAKWTVEIAKAIEAEYKLKLKDITA